MENFNADLVGLDALYNRIIQELFHSVSSGVNEMNKFDMERTLSYISALRYKLDYLVKQAEVDQPKSHPRLFPFRQDAQFDLVENEGANELINKFVLARDEMRLCASTRVASGIKGFDAKRQYSYIADIEGYIKDYLANATPLDFVESSPVRAMTPPGKVVAPARS